MLDKLSPLPIYYQIEEDIKRRIQHKDFIAGEAIPSERELCELYSVSRMTVRQAIQNLVGEDLLVRKKERGTFVSEQKIEQPLQGLTSFTEDMVLRGMVPSNKLLSFKKINPSKEITDKLTLDENDEVFLVERIRYADLKPMAIETTYIPTKLFPKLNEKVIQHSFYAYIEELELTIDRATQAIEAAIIEPDEAELLNADVNSAVLRINRLSYLQEGTPFELVHATYRSDRYIFTSDITRVNTKV